MWYYGQTLTVRHEVRCAGSVYKCQKLASFRQYYLLSKNKRQIHKYDKNVATPYQNNRYHRIPLYFLCLSWFLVRYKRRLFSCTSVIVSTRIVDCVTSDQIKVGLVSVRKKIITVKILFHKADRVRQFYRL